MEKKLFTLAFLDEEMKKLNVRSWDGDKPSPLSGVTLQSADSNLHQHGIIF